MAKRYVLLLGLLAVGLLSGGCGVSPGSMTPEDAVRQETLSHVPNLAAFKVLGTRASERGTVVIYTYIMSGPNQEPTPMIGFRLVNRTLWGSWEVTAGSAGNSSEPPSSENMISYATSGIHGGQFGGDLSIVYGRVLWDQVRAVDATFDNGQTIRDEAADGAFALFTPSRAVACELRVLGAEGKVLRTIDLARGQIPSCKPMSQ